MMKKKYVNLIYILLSFLIPFVVTFIIFKNNGLYPFTNDNKTVLLIDAQGQYIAFYRYYKAILSGDANVIYTLGKAIGGNMLSIFTYYLASPFYLLFAFTSEANLPEMLLLITLLKIATCGLTSFIFLKKSINNNSFALLLSISYSLISYNFVYYSNLMWLDGVYLLPLVLLGIKNIINQKSSLLYMITLTISLYTSWYIGYMICLFSVIFYLVELFKTYNFKDNKKLIIHNIITFGITSLLGGFLSAFSWMSAFIHLSGTKGSVNLKDTVINMLNNNYYLINVFKYLTFKSFEGTLNINNSDNYRYAMSTYIGAIGIVFMLIYFINNNIPKRKRLLSLIPVSLLILGFINVGIDNLYHGGAKPTWFPFRYAFIFGMYALYLASETINDIDKIHPLRLLIPLSLFVILTIISSNINKINENYVTYTPHMFSFVAFAFILLIVVLNYYLKKYKWLKPLSAGVFIIFNICNMYLNSNDIVSKISSNNLNYITYRNDEKLSEIINSIKLNDTSFYRLEKTFMRDGSYNGANNDSMYYNYNGISHYSSNEKKEVQEYLSRLGFHYNYFWEKYGSGSTLSINSFLGIKYILSNSNNQYNYLNNSTKSNTFLNYIYKNSTISKDSINVYENPYALPLMIVVNNCNTVSEGYRYDNEIHWYDHFEYQNNIYKTMISTVTYDNGKQKDIFNKANYTISTNLEYEDTINGKMYKEINKNDTITYKVTTNKSYPFYYNFKNNYNYLDYFRDRLNLRIDNSSINYFSYYNSGINGLPSKNGEQNIRIEAKKKMTNQSIIEEFYYEDLDVLNEYVNEIKKQSVKEISINGTKYEYEVNVTKDNQIALLTLPYEDNFNVYVDNKKVDAKKSYNIFLGVELSKGNHIVKIEYLDKGLISGSIISFLSLITIVSYTIYEEIIRKEKNKTLSI